MPKTKRSTTFAKQPNVASLTEVRVYRLKDNGALSLEAKITGPITDQPAIESALEYLHEDFRVAAMEQHDAIAEIGELRERKAQYLFAAPFAEPSVEEEI